MKILILSYYQSHYHFAGGKAPKKGRSGGRPAANPDKQNRFNFFEERRKKDDENEEGEEDDDGEVESEILTSEVKLSISF